MQSNPRGGSGLGLAQSREIVRIHGGKLEFAACFPVTFTLQLPLTER
jgi:signal transduction histidine kinase